jgi:hypothetical protein
MMNFYVTEYAEELLRDLDAELETGPTRKTADSQKQHSRDLLIAQVCREVLSVAKAALPYDGD